MIRTSYPISPMKQIQLRLDLATRRTRRALELRRRSLLTETDRRAPESAEEEEAAQLHSPLHGREALKRTREAYEEFYDRYDVLIGLLCLAAHQGIEPHLEEEYRDCRAWFLENYAQRVRQLIAPHLPPDATLSPGDAFEPLYLPPSITAMLEQDDGDLIDHMMRSQAALEAWEKSLRSAEQEAAAIRSR